MEQLQSHIWLTASSYMWKYLHISSYIRKLFLPSFLSVYVRGRLRAVWFCCARHERQIPLCTLFVHALLFDVKRYHSIFYYFSMRFAITEAVRHEREISNTGGKNWILSKIQMQTSSSETLIGWKSGKTTYVPLWDRMEGAWLWTLGTVAKHMVLIGSVWYTIRVL